MTSIIFGPDVQFNEHDDVTIHPTHDPCQNAGAPRHYDQDLQVDLRIRTSKIEVVDL